MELLITVSGQRCDLSLHPVSAKTVERIRTMGRKFYTKKYIHWWRNGNTSTCGMKFDDDCAVRITLDGRDVPFDTSRIPRSAVLLRRRHYLESKARYLALLGYDDECCTMVWKWTIEDGFDPDKFEFFVHRWDRIIGSKDYLILDDVRYDGAFADMQDWGGSCGFNLVDPRIIDLEEVRRELGVEPAPPSTRPKPVRIAPPPVSPPAPAAVMDPVPACTASGPPFIRKVENPNATAYHNCSVCKDFLRVDLRIEDDFVVEAGGMAEGCDYSKECLQTLCGMITGKSVYDCYPITNDDLREKLPRVIPRLDCDYFTVGALKIALRNWERAVA
jgi:NifU-like protein involved in Fe-S cluster formation